MNKRFFGFSVELKKILITAAFSAFFAFEIFAEKGDFSLTVEPKFTLKNGTIGEYVFLKDAVYADDTLSFLDWQIKNIPCFEVTLNASYKNFFVETTFSGAQPKNSGIMKDSDWLNNYPSQNTEGKSQYDYKTNYSEHTNYLDSAFEAAVFTGYNFNVTERIQCSAKLGFEFTHTAFTGCDGEYWYGKSENGTPYTKFDSENISHGYFSGDVIKYTRNEYIVWLGGDFFLRATEKFNIRAGLYAAPYTFTENLDNHLKTNSDYLDLCTGIFASYRANLGIGCTFNEKVSLFLDYSLYGLRKIRGNSYSKYSSQKYFYQDTTTQSGVSSITHSVSVSFCFTLI